ncbi:MAG: MBL fold metallo-hydrolase [Clostridiales bacterium]|jgi:glyoxylase-like metal-dependent hydrolase (beta-lactamase superfamily II)|nr:MBL fold metallo-hydrolase [Clostridiales bacterium]
MEFFYRRLTEGLLGSNTYFVWVRDPDNPCAVIDPGNKTSKILQVIEKENLQVKYIILTHVHIDHVFYLDELRDALPLAKVLCHESELPAFQSTLQNASNLFGSGKVFKAPDVLLKDGDIVKLGEGVLKIIHTPGHTPGGICILAGDLLFTGDTLFYDGFGRTDLGFGDVKDLKASIEKLYKMDPNIKVFPGHGTSTTIGRERENSPFLEW